MRVKLLLCPTNVNNLVLYNQDMGESFLIFGGSIKQREALAVKTISRLLKKKSGFDCLKNFGSFPDIKIVKQPEEKKSIGIAETKEAVKFLVEKPFNLGQKIIIVWQAEKMTREAQNSLLKTLEEPPSYASVILVAKTQNDLLETLVSRCKNVSAESRKDTIIYTPAEGVVGKSLAEVLKMSYGQRLDWAGEISKEEREDIIEMLEEWIKEGRGVILKNLTDLKMVKNIKLIIAIKKDLENTNVSGRLSIEALVLNLS